MTYNQNIERLRQSSHTNYSRQQRREEERAKLYGQEQIDDAAVVTQGLSAFSNTLKSWAEDKKEKDLVIGKEAAQRAREEAARRRQRVEKEAAAKKAEEEDIIKRHNIRDICFAKNNIPYANIYLD